MPALKKRKSLGKTRSRTATPLNQPGTATPTEAYSSFMPRIASTVPPAPTPRPQMLQQARQSIESGQSGPAAMHNARLRSADQIAAQSQARVNQMFAPRYDQAYENMRQFIAPGDMPVAMEGMPAGLQNAQAAYAGRQDANEANMQRMMARNANQESRMLLPSTGGRDALIAAGNQAYAQDASQQAAYASAERTRRGQMAGRYYQGMAEQGRIAQRPDGSVAILGPNVDAEAVARQRLPMGGNVSTRNPTLTDEARTLQRAKRLGSRLRRMGGLEKAGQSRTAALLRGMGPAGEFQLAQMQAAPPVAGGPPLTMNFGQAAAVQDNARSSAPLVGAGFVSADANKPLPSLSEIDMRLTQAIDGGTIDDELIAELQRLIDSYKKTDTDFTTEIAKHPLLSPFSGGKATASVVKERLAAIRKRHADRSKRWSADPWSNTPF